MLELYSNTLLLMTVVGILSLILGLFLTYTCLSFSKATRVFLVPLLIAPLCLPLEFYVLTYFEAFDMLKSDLRGFWPLSLLMSLNFAPYIFLSLIIPLSKESASITDWMKIHHISLSQKFMYSLRKNGPWVITGLIFVLAEVLGSVGGPALMGWETFSVKLYTEWSSYYTNSTYFVTVVHLLGLGFCLYLLEKVLSLCFDSKAVGDEREAFHKGSFFARVILVSWVGVSVVIPFLVLIWNVPLKPEIWLKGVSSFFQTLVLALSVAFIVLLFVSVIKSLVLKSIMSSLYFIPSLVLGFLGFYLFSDVMNWKLLVFVVCSLFLALKFFRLAERFWERSKNEFWSPGLRSFCSLEEIQFSKKLIKIYIPFYSKVMGVLFFLIFLEVGKELPITLILHPTGFEPLSLSIFNSLLESQREQAVVPALFLFLFALLGCFLFKTPMRKGESS